MHYKIRQWILAPVFEDEEKNRSSTLLNIVLWMFIAASSLYGILAPIEPQNVIQRVVIIGPFVTILLFLKQMLNMGYVRSAGHAIVGILWAALTASMFFGADYNNPAYMGYVIVVVTAGLTLNWRATMGWSVLSIATNAIIVTLGQTGYLILSGRETPPAAFWLAQTVYILVTALLLSQATRKIDEAFNRAHHELSERKLVEAEREKFIEELEAKNAELERFTYTVSHDLKSPLITIGGYLGFLEKDIRNGDLQKFDNDITRIREAATKMQALLNDLLELSRIGRIANPAEEVNFGEIAKEALAIVEGHLRERNIRVETMEHMPSVLVDRARLVEVIQNLLENAAKFTDDKKQPIIQIGWQVMGKEDVFFVRDNGIGIYPSHHERIFGLFNKLSTDTEGTGIGLALVKRIIEVHGGRIWVESEVGRGTTFYFTLKKNT